jgi:hypothetical protein
MASNTRIGAASVVTLLPTAAEAAGGSYTVEDGVFHRGVLPLGPASGEHHPMFTKEGA